MRKPKTMLKKLPERYLSMMMIQKLTLTIVGFIFEKN